MAFNYFGSRLLKAGSAGDDVIVLQTLLNKLPPSIALPISEETVFGPKTEASLKQFQGYFGLTVDGKAGQGTYLYFGEVTGPFLPTGTNAFGARTLKSGMAGNDVWVLQNRLNGAARKYANALGSSADGQFGPKTQAAVKLFQKDFGLGEDGIVGPMTFNKLYVETNFGGRFLQKDRTDRNKGYDVLFLQMRLKDLGYYSGGLDGKFGSSTEAAVKALQTAAKISADGVVGPKTYFNLGKK